MHEPYDDDEYYEDNYSDQYDIENNQDHLKKFYFSFDIDSLYNYMINSLSNFPVVQIPVSSWFSNTENGGNSVLYLGNNYQNQPIWKTHYLIKHDLEIAYKNHIKNHPGHFVRQPNYYKGMFDILN